MRSRAASSSSLCGCCSALVAVVVRLALDIGTAGYHTSWGGRYQPVPTNAPLQSHDRAVSTALGEESAMSTGRLTWFALAVWCASVFGLGAAGAFVGQPGQPPLALVAAALLPLAVFASAYRGSRTFRDFVLAADLRLVTAFQAWR